MVMFSRRCNNSAKLTARHGRSRGASRAAPARRASCKEKCRRVATTGTGWSRTRSPGSPRAGPALVGRGATHELAATRRDVERLFGVSKARAATLMQTFGAEMTGYQRTLPRTKLPAGCSGSTGGRAAFRHEEERRECSVERGRIEVAVRRGEGRHGAAVETPAVDATAAAEVTSGVPAGRRRSCCRG